MTSKKIIERLQQKDWFVKCKTEHELALVSNACLDADIPWFSGTKASRFAPDLLASLIVISRQNHLFKRRIGFAYCASPCECEDIDITDWFFEELRSE
ncbi:hypothetical protein A9G35_03800 [Gilliamella sp. Choc5-1]|uniref:hypothetical protein n=1 Tax=Gilliamella sp. Choc5-1 TaxID=3120238 RepID=UPI00080ED430|nr:hypothetical protein [Gilliamella apicola]OCG47475.1 hypothetical protein A9G35_03800 [Gilliamella apicola]